jgi:FG-GAP-like repeat
MKWSLALGLVVMGCEGASTVVATDAAGGIDAPAAATCGDGHRDPGEVCFRPAGFVSAPGMVNDAQFGDVDGDGDHDIVHVTEDRFVAHLNVNGTFTQPAVVGPAVTATLLRSRDLDGDGRVELIVATEGRLELWRSSAGGFNPTRTGQVDVPPGFPGGLVLAELDGVAPPEVVTLTGTVLQVSSIGAGLTLVERARIPAPSGSRVLRVGRFDGDDLDDVAIAGQGGITVLRGNGGGLDPLPSTSISSSVGNLITGDFDGDSHTDLLFIELDRGGLLRGAGDGSFLAPTPFGAGTVLNYGLAADDVDGDDRDDVLIGMQFGPTWSVGVALGRAGGVARVDAGVPVGVSPQFLHADADPSGDGSPDLVVSTRDLPLVYLYLSDP